MVWEILISSGLGIFFQLKYVIQFFFLFFLGKASVPKQLWIHLEAFLNKMFLDSKST